MMFSTLATSFGKYNPIQLHFTSTFFQNLYTSGPDKAYQAISLK